MDMTDSTGRLVPNQDGERNTDPTVGRETTELRATGSTKGGAGQSTMGSIMLEDLERQYIAIRAERDELEKKLEDTMSRLLELQEKEQNYKKVQQEVDSHKNQLALASSKNKALEEECKLMQERLERQQAEKDRLHDELSSVSKKRAELQEALDKHILQESRGNTRVVPLMLEKERLQKELESLQAHSNWLSAELESKSSVQQATIKEQRKKIQELTSQLQQAQEKSSDAEDRVAAMKKRLDDDMEKFSQLSRKLLASEDDRLQEKEKFEIELHEERRLSSLQKRQLQLWEERFGDVTRENENLKRTASEALDAAKKELQRELDQCTEKYEALLKEQAADFQIKLQRLHPDPSGEVDVGARLSISPPESADVQEVGDDSNDDGPLSMSDLYDRWMRTRQALERERIDKDRWKLQLQRVQEEIRMKTPGMIRQREEYEFAMNQVQSYKSRLEDALNDRDDARRECKEAVRELSKLKQDLDGSKAELSRMSKQVQALLSKAEGIPPTTDTDDIPLSVAELQDQNSRLWKERQELATRVSELEASVRSLAPVRDLADAKIKKLEEERDAQVAMMGSLVEQRDLYRALAFKETGETPNNALTNTVATAQEFSSRCKELEQQNAQLKGEISSLKSECDGLMVDKEAMVQCLARQEAQIADGNRLVDRLHNEERSARSEAVRNSLEIEHLKRQVERLEAESARAREELRHWNETVRPQWQRQQDDLEDCVAKARKEAEELRAELQASERKLRRAEAQYQVALAAETRLKEERKQLGDEIEGQAKVLEAIRKIEVGLSTKTQDDFTAAKKEAERLSQKLEENKKQYAGEVEALRTRISQYELQTQEMLDSKDKLQSETIRLEKALAQKEQQNKLLVASEQALKKEIDTLKRIDTGIAGSGEDGRVSLQSRIDGLSSELEQAQSEAKELKLRCAEYKKLASEHENALKDARRAIEENQAVYSSKIAQLEEKNQDLQKGDASQLKALQDMTSDLASQLSRQKEREVALEAEIQELQSNRRKLEDNKGELEAMIASMQEDVMRLNKEAAKSQENYERELLLHSEARSAARKAREEADEQKKARMNLQSEIEDIREEQRLQKEVAETEQLAIQESLRIAEKRLVEAHEQNTCIQKQLEAFASATTEPALPGDAKSGEVLNEDSQIAHLQKTVKFLQSDNEMVQLQLENTKRAFEREKASCAVLRRNLDEVRAELETLQRAKEETPGENLQEINTAKEQLVSSEENAKLLLSANKLLREQTQRLQEKLSQTQSELTSLKESSKPNEKIRNDLELKVATLSAEKESMLREVDSWRSRVESLVSKFNQIDPAEHQKVLDQLASLQEENKSLNAWKKTTEEENTRIRTIAKNLNVKAREQKNQIDEQQKLISQLREEKTRSSASSSSVEKERDELKEKVTKLEKDAASAKTELDGANKSNQRLREHLRSFQTKIRDLKTKEKELADEVAALKATRQQATASKQTEGKEGRKVSSGNSLKQVTEVDRILQVPAGGFVYGPSTVETVTELDKTGSEDAKKHFGKDEGKDMGTVESATNIQQEQSIEDSLSSKVGTEKSSLKHVSDTSETKNKPILLKEEPSEAVKVEEPSRTHEKEMSIKERLLQKKRRLAEKIAAESSESKKSRIADYGSRDDGDEATKKIKADSSSLPENESAETEAKDIGGKQIIHKSGSVDQGLETPNPQAEKGVVAKTPTNESFVAEIGSDADTREAEEAIRLLAAETARQAADERLKKLAAQEATRPNGTSDQSVENGSSQAVELAGSQDRAGTVVGKEGEDVQVPAHKEDVKQGQPPEHKEKEFKETPTNDAPGFTKGGAFLDLKPPGNVSAPTFSFGTSETIKLQAPTVTAPAPAPFSVFASARGASAGTSIGSLPLFSDASTVDSETKKESKTED